MTDRSQQIKPVDFQNMDHITTTMTI